MKTKRMPHPEGHRSDSGVALVLVLLAILVLTTLAAGMIFNQHSEAMASYNYRIGTQAEYVARAGVEKAVNFFKSANYVPLPQASVSTYYASSTYATNPVNLFFSNLTPVTCLAACSGGAGNVFLGTTTGSSIYPPKSATNNVDVVSNWVSWMNNQQISDGMATNPESGNYTVTATLLEYHTVNNAFFGVPASGCSDPSSGLGICRQAYEVWQVTSTGNWNNTVGGAAGATPTVQMVATVAPMYLPYFGNALYGLCNVTLSGNVCTDSYNSSGGAYSGSAGSCATPGSTGSNSQASGGGIGSNGGVTVNGGAYTIGGNVTFANQGTSGACNTGFTGSSNGVAGSVLPGPSIPIPPAVNMAPWGYPRSNPVITPPSAGGSTNQVTNVLLNVTAVPSQPTGISALCPSIPPGQIVSGHLQAGFVVSYTEKTSSGNPTYSNLACSLLSGTGTSSAPYILGNIEAGNGSGGNSGNINIVAPAGTPGSAIYVAANSVNVGNNGFIVTATGAPPTPTSGSFDPNAAHAFPPTATNAPALILDVATTFSMGGQSALNYNTTNPGVPPPDYLLINVDGTGNALSLSGQAELNALVTVPNGNATLAGSGAGGTFFGSILAQSVTDSGNYAVHYDVSSKTASGQMFASQVMSTTRPMQ